MNRQTEHHVCDLEKELPELSHEITATIESNSEMAWMKPVPSLSGITISTHNPSIASIYQQAKEAATNTGEGKHIYCLIKVPEIDSLADPNTGPSHKFENIDSLEEPPNSLTSLCEHWYNTEHYEIEEFEDTTFAYLEGFYLKLHINPDGKISKVDIVARYTNKAF